MVGREDQSSAGIELDQVSAAGVGHVDEKPFVGLVPRRRTHHALQPVLGNPVEREKDFLAAIEAVTEVVEHRCLCRDVRIGEDRDVV